MLRKLFKLLGLGLFGIVVAILAVTMFAGGANYNTDFPPPNRLDAVAWPNAVGGRAAEITQLATAQSAETKFVGSGLSGLTARYGENASVTVVQIASQSLLDAYLETVKPRLERYSNRSSGKLNGAWWLKGGGQAGRLYGWQRQNWFYLIQAANDDLFNETVEKFPHIALK